MSAVSDATLSTATAAVAQYLPKITNLFDLVIIDEASQMPPQNALGAILRGNNSVIVGDTNQLPPSTFFKKHVEDETADEDEQVLEESILEMANNAFRPKRRLRWHYRSRHSALIAFSNRIMYDDDLILFPSAHESRPDMGVKHHQVEGNYKGGRNAKEAADMLEIMIDR